MTKYVENIKMTKIYRKHQNDQNNIETLKMNKITPKPKK